MVSSRQELAGLPGGRVQAAAAVTQSEEMQLREATRQAWMFRLVAENLSGFVGVWALSGESLYLNPVAVQALGFADSAAALERSMGELILDTQGGPVQGEWLTTVLRDGREETVAHLHHAVSGEQRPIRLSLLRVDDPVTQEPFAVAALAVLGQTGEGRPAPSSSPSSFTEAPPAREPAPPIPAAEDKPVRPLIILLADDDLVNRRLASLMVERLGHPRPSLAVDGAAAVAAALAGAFDLVLMDVEMPDLDGLEAARQIRQGLADRCPYLLAMSANAAPEDRERCLVAGFDDFTPKPLTRNGLAIALGRVSRDGDDGIDDFSAAAWSALVQAYRAEGAAQLVLSLVEDVPDQRQRHAEAQRARDMVRLRRLAHGLRGTCLQLGATDLAAACARVEAATAAEPALAASLCEDVMVRYGALVERWRAQLANV